MKNPANIKYRPYHECFSVQLPDRLWPEKKLERAPIWCSVDLRDGNQALINPMNLKQKLEMFKLLLALGFKEIEIGFPSASQVEYDFTRALVEGAMIPADVTPQVLTQARPHLIQRTFEALAGTRRAIVHLYNSTSELQRRVVFQKDKDEIKKIAVDGTKLVKDYAQRSDTEIVLQYSPESFTGTELPFALEVCEAVIEEWGATPDRKMIINLPATVEMSTPNVHADQIEWFCRNLKNRESVIISLHPHNDRGTGIAAAELGLLAGGERVEGTLFGNGERTGNVDIIALALNLYTQGVDPGLVIDDIEEIKRISEKCTGLPVHERHPYAGELVFTAFSGSHQDAINKGFKALHSSRSSVWEVPYLPIDPRDIGRKYDAIIRINSQSGKGGVAYVLSNEFGCDLPKDMHPEFGALIQTVSDSLGTEVPSHILWETFEKEYISREAPLKLVKFRSALLDDEGESVEASLNLELRGDQVTVKGVGNGPIDAALKGLNALGLPRFAITNFSEHARSSGSDAQAVAYVQLQDEDGFAKYGVGIHSNTSIAAIRAMISAVNRFLS